jgi:hypothetical protein
MNRSDLTTTMARIATHSAEAVGDYLRSTNAGLNRHIRRTLALPPGQPGSLLADPIIEVAQDWAEAGQSLGDLAGGLLDRRLVEALDTAPSERMPRDRKPYLHQLRAWEAAGQGQSVLVSSGTGSGKTECFMIPVLDDILRNPGPVGGIRAIIVYPLNALIQSQRDRLSAWAAGLGGQVSYALYNGETPHRPDGTRGAPGEVLDRRSLREKPPSILVTNITMLEYMLLRAEDQPILKKSQGLLRWIVLDEAHSYVGAQASEMAMLLRRVRAGFGVRPDEVRLMATSATIEDDTGTRLTEFMQGLSGVDASGIRIIKGETVEPPLPAPGADVPLDLPALQVLPDDRARWQALAPHPRMQSLRARMKSGLTLGEIAQHLLQRADARNEAEAILDLVAQARAEPASLPLMRWRGHLFLRALGGAWACLDPACRHAAPELRETGDWPFGQVHFTARERCTCGAPCMELAVCDECGTPHLKARQEFGIQHRLVLSRSDAEDDFSTDIEPDTDADRPAVAARSELWVTSAPGRGRLVHLNSETLEILSNAAGPGPGFLPLQVVDDEPICTCDETRTATRFKYLRFSPAFLMGQNIQSLIEAFSQPDPSPAQKPLAGRGAISFTDSRQGVARLAAKMQAEAERTLTRAFLWHETQAAQEGRGDDAGKIADLERAIGLLGANAPAMLTDQLATMKMAQTSARGVAWKTAVNDLAGHSELALFVREVWRDRSDDFARGDNEALARILLMREMMRRPTRQNNAETMGLARLAFPVLEDRVMQQPVPAMLQGRAVTAGDYLGLVLAAVDFFFREKMVIALEPERHLRWIAPKWGRLHKACSNDVRAEDRLDSLPFPTALVKENNRMHRLGLIALALTGGSRRVEGDLEEADELLRQVFRLISSSICRQWSAQAVALDFEKAEIRPYDRAWLCPVSRRVFGYAIKACSPLDLSRPMLPLHIPQAPVARRGGLTADERAELADWLDSDPAIAALRESGAWSGLSSRAVLYPAYMRAQEHSAQLPRLQLKDYEDAFNAGRINLLACSTTMEMGVDLSNVGLVVNSNVPPSVSNYRQRVGRAGRRREPWAFGATWCRDLPLDKKVFEEPRRLLHGRMAAPRVTLNSPILMQRHVNAAAFAGWMRMQGGMSVTQNVGSFFGMDDQGRILPDAPVDRFLAALTGSDAAAVLPAVGALLKGSCLEGRAPADLARAVAQEMTRVATAWRDEYRGLIQRSKATGEPEVEAALRNRAASMQAAFLLSDLSRAGFTPAYGFPSDVVSFDHIGGKRRHGEATRDEVSGRNGATRTLDVALREYAPGADIVINGMVYASEGIRPAWSTTASASNLEDLRQFVRCTVCGKPHLSRMLPESCACGAAVHPEVSLKTLRPVGFVGRREPHIGYELLQGVAFRMPEISADDAAWQDIHANAGFRLRATASGRVITLGSGQNDEGYAICLICGRAESENAADGTGRGPVPSALRGHRPLVSGAKDTMVSGRCRGGDDPQRIQRHVHLMHDRHTDVFELQMPAETSPGTAFALAAALRESLARWLGVEVEEIGISVGPSRGADQSRRASAYLHDRAAGGAGLSLRLGEPGRLAALTPDLVSGLDCPERCLSGCPACILRPDMNLSEVVPDREAALALAIRLRNLLRLDPRKQVFGPETVALSMPLFELVSRHVSQRTARSITLFARGRPGQWALTDWPVLNALPLWRQQLPVEVVFASASLDDPALDVPTRLQLLRIAQARGLAHRPDLPECRLLPLLAIIETADGLQAVAAAAQSEALPDEAWGRGAADLLVTGPMDALPDWTWKPATDLLPRSEVGKSAHSILGKRMDVPVSDFGKAFWRVLAQDAPALSALLAQEGVAELRYDDRYLLRPIQFQLLREILLALPGRKADTGLRIYTMHTTLGESPRHLGDTLASDHDRETLFDELFPGERIAILSKSETEHARSLTITTGNGQKMLIYLDQGMDLWQLATRCSTTNGLDMVRLAKELDQTAAPLVARTPNRPTMFTCLV